MKRIYDADLSGLWQFTPEGGEKRTIAVPGGGWLKQGIDCEAGTYETTIYVPDTGSPQVTILELGAVNHLAKCYLNDALIHEEVTAFTPQNIDLTDHVTPGQSYCLKLFVRAFENGRPIAPHWAEWSAYTARGIFRSAWLRVYPAVYVSEIQIVTSVKDATFIAHTSIYNATDTVRRVHATGAFSSVNGMGWQYPDLPEQSIDLSPRGATKAVFGPVKWTAGVASYWWPNVPYREGYRAQLHHFTCAVADADFRHEKTARFGFRESRQDGPYFTLNSVRVNYRGDNLQVANYDQIDNNGKGDAIDTLPGFLPPDENNPGWPKAVDNFLRLNYNVQRTHMGPWTPYMLDVCDEMGLMLIGESACRWNEFDMDDGRGRHEVKCLRDIILRDRNHASIMRWSSKNEAQCTDPEYHLELYNAIKELDDTRPIFEDYLYMPGGVQEPDKVFTLVKDKPDFTWMDHYFTLDDQGKPYFSPLLYNDAVLPMADRPYGVTEANWMRSSTPAGMAWFATCVALGRAAGASDMRPYVLCSYWASSVPGVRTTEMLTEENRHPVYGEDNLPNPWLDENIKLLQKAYHPLLAMDFAFWWENRKCDPWGHFPITAPRIRANEAVVREITVFNDEFVGEELELRWEAREGSPSNWIWESGRIPLSIRLGFSAVASAQFRASKFNTYMFLTLEVYKGGVLRFRDDMTAFEVVDGEDFRSEFNGQERIFK